MNMDDLIQETSSLISELKNGTEDKGRTAARLSSIVLGLIMRCNYLESVNKMSGFKAL